MTNFSLTEVGSFFGGTNFLHLQGASKQLCPVLQLRLVTRKSPDKAGQLCCLQKQPQNNWGQMLQQHSVCQLNAL
jgi:hypothetical protein